MLEIGLLITINGCSNVANDQTQSRNFSVTVSNQQLLNNIAEAIPQMPIPPQKTISILDSMPEQDSQIFWQYFQKLIILEKKLISITTTIHEFERKNAK